MARRTTTRHPSLSATIARGLLEHQNVAEFEHLFETITQLGDLHDGLVAVRTATDPLMTREAQAVKYRDQHRRATQRAEELINRSAKRLTDRMNRVVTEAHARAGIATPPAEAAEIRSALRAMSPRDRDRAIGEAIERGDVAVIASIRGASPLLVGPTTIPIDELVGLHVDKLVPTLPGDLEACEHALRNLDMARDAFAKAAEEMRDPQAEADADDGIEAARQAEAKLGLALQVRGETE